MSDFDDNMAEWDRLAAGLVNLMSRNSRDGFERSPAPAQAGPGLTLDILNEALRRARAHGPLAIYSTDETIPAGQILGTSPLGPGPYLYILNPLDESSFRDQLIGLGWQVQGPRERTLPKGEQPWCIITMPIDEAARAESPDDLISLIEIKARLRTGRTVLSIREESPPVNDHFIQGLRSWRVKLGPPATSGPGSP